MGYSTLWTLLGASLLLLLYRLRNVGRRPAGLPPGPPTLPIIGNLHQMPTSQPHYQFQAWAREYGPVYSLVLGTKIMIVLSSDRAVKDLLDKRSAIYSDRSDVYLGNIISGNSRMLLMRYGDTWRMIRRLVHNHLNIRASRVYVPYQDLENKAMLKGFLDEPERFVEQIRRYTNSLTTQIVFGFRTTSTEDPRLKRLFRCFEQFSVVMSTQTAALLNVFPVLRHLPDFMLPMRRYAKELHREEYDMFVGYYNDCKKRVQNGTAKPSFCIDLIHAQRTQGFSDRIAAYTAGSLLEAGSDTTANSLVGFVQAMTIFPEVARKAQEELDRVVGDSRMPDLNDWPDLPYVRGCIKETLRWMPTPILGMPHAVTRDDEYMGYKIPKGADLLWNVWSIHMDPARHPSPRVFDPTRWSGDDTTSAESALSADPAKRDHFVFGAGRRLCQGMHIADRSLFFAVSRLLWGFEFGRYKDTTTGGEEEKEGEEEVPDMEDLTEGFLVMPRKFRSSIKPRSEARAELVRREWERAKGEVLDGEGQWKVVPEGMAWKDEREVGE